MKRKFLPFLGAGTDPQDLHGFRLFHRVPQQIAASRSTGISALPPGFSPTPWIPLCFLDSALPNQPFLLDSALPHGLCPAPEFNPSYWIQPCPVHSALPVFSPALWIQPCPMNSALSLDSALALCIQPCPMDSALPPNLALPLNSALPLDSSLPPGFRPAPGFSPSNLIQPCP